MLIYSCLDSHDRFLRFRSEFVLFWIASIVGKWSDNCTCKFSFKARLTLILKINVFDHFIASASEENLLLTSFQSLNVHFPSGCYCNLDLKVFIHSGFGKYSYLSIHMLVCLYFILTNKLFISEIYQKPKQHSPDHFFFTMG